MLLYGRISCLPHIRSGLPSPYDHRAMHQLHTIPYGYDSFKKISIGTSSSNGPSFSCYQSQEFFFREAHRKHEGEFRERNQRNQRETPTPQQTNLPSREPSTGKPTTMPAHSILSMRSHTVITTYCSEKNILWKISMIFLS